MGNSKGKVHGVGIGLSWDTLFIIVRFSCGLGDWADGKLGWNYGVLVGTHGICPNC